MFSYLSAPYPIAWRDVTAEQRDMGSLVQLVFNNVSVNLARFGERLVIIQLVLIAQVVIVIAISAVFTIRHLLAARSAQGMAGIAISERWFHVFSLGGIMAANFVLYDVYGWSGYRVFAPYLLLSLLLLVAFGRFRLVGLIIISNVLFAPLAIATFHLERAPDFYRDMRNVHVLRDQLDDYIVYNPAAPNGWCNTIVLYGNVLPEYLAVPRGIGTTRGAGEAPPPRSRWLMIPGTGPLAQWLDEEQLNVEHLAETTMGSLYRNLDAEC